MPKSVQGGQVEAVRRFSRFYTRLIGLLGEHLLASGFSLAQSRILYELAHRDRVGASALAQELGLDPGYLSRILKAFDAKGFLVRAASTADGRRTELTLSEAGHAAFAPLDKGSRDEITALLTPLSSRERTDLVGAMGLIERLLGTEPPRPAAPYSLRPLQVGDLGWIVRRQGLLYAREYGFDATFEALVAEIGAAFVKTRDPAWENCWIAERDGEVVGSVFLVRASVEVAKLRLLYVEEATRGLGIGRGLTDACIGFARERGYHELTLWTNDILVAARGIYAKAGFRLVAEEPHHSFGRDMVGETWTLDLR